ncbi:MAG: 3-hydroxyacyl-CoA dehydrogenase/enoyl-CoA hydratase family protein [Alphaproteobacteria bacterium]|nr:3-hydroxyacyl-CoA dehydrogenase/enoyl-CoA hydratase family protein [Alphaproteobacteria bacterium]
MATQIRKVAVLGAGVMGQGIAAHLANAGVPSVLYDIVPKGLADGEPRSKLAIDGIVNATKLKPAAFYKKELSSLITPANYEDDGALLGECDLIIEAVVENIKIKNIVFDWVEKNRAPHAIVATNTSGLSLDEMAAEMSPEMRAHFLVMHFFNPVRYMRLLELVIGPDTRPDVAQAVADFGREKMGKGIVFGKDTPNFIANRIGTFGMVSVFHHMGALGLTVEEVDAVFGPAMGRPKSAVFRTADLVGNDTLSHVLETVHAGCPDDEMRERFVVPGWLTKMVEEGATGDKGGKGFYMKSRDASGGRVILARNLETGEYAPAAKVRFDSLGKARNKESAGDKVKAVLAGDDKAAQFAWKVTADTLIYSANRIPEIADDIVNIDRSMRWGFAWDMGPFESWDAIGVAESVERMQADGLTVPAWVLSMLQSGRKSFYERDAQGRMTYWCVGSGGSKLVDQPSSWLILPDLKAQQKVVAFNPSAELYDLGDGVLGLSFRTKMNALDDGIVELAHRALDELDEGKWEALVIGNQGGNAFSAGANLMMVGMAAMQGDWKTLETMIETLQTTLQRAKYSKRPVVTAPWGLTLGGGAEVAMHSAHTQAAGELYMGLVEVGVGLIPAGGGCKEMLTRYLGDIPEGTEYDPNPFVQAAYKNIALAKVATSAEEARAIGYLRPTDRLTLDPDQLIHDAKKAALGLAQGGYTPPRKRRFKLPGPQGRAAIELFLYQMHEGKYATDHDVVVGKELARVMTGGDIPRGRWFDEDEVLALEREAFLTLCGMEATQARIQHMLMKGKPLRN